MKKNLLIVTLILFISIHQLCMGQIQSMGFVQRYVNPRTEYGFRDYVYRPQLKVLDDTLYACTNNGIYRKDLIEDGEWELYAFKNIPITEFVKNGDKLLAISTGTSDGTDSLLLLSSDNGHTCINFTSPHFLQYGSNYLFRMVQNPENRNCILVLHGLYGLSKSDDFGLTWRNLNESHFGDQNWYVGFHPLDTNTIFYSGEMMAFQGTYLKSSDAGETWSAYTHPGGDNCIHSFAFHPADPNILVYSGEGAMAKSTDKGETWTVTDLYDTGMYFYKVLFDEDDPVMLYASGLNGKYISQDSIWVYRSSDMGESWELAYQEYIEDCGGVFDMVKYKNLLIFYTRESGLFQLDLGTITSNSHIKTIELTVFPNPIQNRLCFETDLSVNHIEIIDQTGRVLQKTNIPNNERQIEISRLPAGIYLAVFHTKEMSVTKKIVVK